MRRVLKKNHRSKGEKQVIRPKKNEILSGHKAALSKDQKKLLTNARLTVPHVQTGIFMKGKKSSTYHREEDGRFNVLNRARMDEKLNDILNLAKPSPKLNHKIVLESEVTIHDTQAHIFPQGKENCANSSHPLISEEQCEKKKYQNFESLSKDSSSSEEKESHPKQSKFVCQKFQPIGKFEENFLESEYTNFKLFITHFDHMSFNLAFPEDFIVQEKLALRKKKKNKSVDHKSFNQFSKLNKERSTTSHSQSSGDEDLMDETNMLKTNNCKNINKTLISKRNLNYNAFKNIKKIQLINASHGQRKNHECIVENRDIFSQHSLPQSPHKNFELPPAEKAYSQKDENKISEIYRFKTKSSLLNPLSFLENSLFERNNHSMPSTSSEPSSLDGFQFLKHSLGLPSSSAPPDLYSTEHRLKKNQLSQTSKSVAETSSKKMNKNLESPMQHRSPSRLNIWKDNLKFNSWQSPGNQEIFDLKFGGGKQTFTNEFQNRDYFSNDNSASKGVSDSEDCISCKSVMQSQTFENLSPILEEINNSPSPIYTQKVTKSLKLENPVLKSTVECYDRKRPCCLHFTDYNDLVSQTIKHPVSVPSISNFQEEDVRANNFWHRRKMF